MRRVLKFVKGRKDDSKRESGVLSSSASGEVLSAGQAPEEEGFLGGGVENGYGYSVDLCGKDKTLTKLHKAAWQGNLEKLKSGLKKVEVDAVDRHNRTALHLAVAKGHPNIVWFLLGNNAKTSICDDEGHSPLLKAIECGHKDCMRLLLERGTDVNVADYSGNTGLHIAVTRGSLDAVSFLLEKAADTGLRNNAGDYPLHIATKLENKELVDLLLAAGASVDVLDRENRTPLMLAAKTGNSVLAQLFIDRGGQLSVVDSNGWTAQDYAMLGGHEDIASSLSARNRLKPDGSRPHPDSPKLRHRTDSRADDIAEATDGEPNLDERSRHVEHDVVEVQGHKLEDSPESPDAEAIPPYCQPPRSWEMIQAGMIDRQEDGNEPKRRSITVLGTLHSRRESFTDPLPSSPKSTLSLNRRRHGKKHNAFAKHRFSLNEEESLSQWVEEKGKGRREGSGGTMVGMGEERSSGDKGVERWGLMGVGAEGGREGDVEGEGEKEFPPPPSGLELGVDMAKSMRCVRGLSVEQALGRSGERKMWRKARESQSLDRLEEREVGGEEVSWCEKSKERVTEVNKRINEQLECYDQALRELEESREGGREEKRQKYYSLPCKIGGEWRGVSWGGNGEGGVEARRKRHVLLAMREVKHEVEVEVDKGLRTSKEGMGDGETKVRDAEESLGSNDKWSLKGVSVRSEGSSPGEEEDAFFGLGREETVLERSEVGRGSEGSGSGEESTLWLQDEGGQRKEDSEEDVGEIGGEEGWKDGRECSFSPLGVIQREMEEESRGRGCSGGKTSPAGEGLCGEIEEHNERMVAEQSPDVSLSSGPIELLGAERDSGSEAESSHNDVSPAHNYALKTQHEWLRCHLRAATLEKNKLEELTVQLTEKAERLQYELADAKEAAKSRDEVIQLLQGQLARMEAAYTKSLEESVQSRLQLTSHEQEILHLKELCYRFQEEKEALGSGAGGECEQETQLRIKALEEEREKLREEMIHMEEEKSMLEGRLSAERQGGAEMMEQCQRWKERCGRLEEMVEGYQSQVAEKVEERMAEEKEVRRERLELERKLMEAREENLELRGRVENLGAMVEREKRRAMGAEEEKEKLKEELRRQKSEVEGELRKLEKEMEEKMVRKLKEKEEEVGGLVAQFNREREWLKERRRGEDGARGVEGGREGGGGKEEGWRSLCGRRVVACSGEKSAEREEEEVGKNRTLKDLDILELKKQILSLESRISDEKNSRRALENEMMKMRVNLNGKENLEMEVDSLKRKVGRYCLGKPGMELLEYERDLQAKRDKYLINENGLVLKHHCDYKAKCEALAKEREKAKHLTKSHRKTLKTFAPPLPPPHPNLPIHSYSSSHPQLLLHPPPPPLQPQPQRALHPDLKNNLDYQLDKSIRKYMQESPSVPPPSNLRI